VILLVDEQPVRLSSTYYWSVVGRGRRCKEIKERNRREGFRVVLDGRTDTSHICPPKKAASFLKKTHQQFEV